MVSKFLLIFFQVPNISDDRISCCDSSCTLFITCLVIILYLFFFVNWID
jgi:hypothetical protein